MAIVRQVSEQYVLTVRKLQLQEVIEFSTFSRMQTEHMKEIICASCKLATRESSIISVL